MKCEYCQESDAEPGYKRCEPCLFREATPEVRYLLEAVKDIYRKLITYIDIK